MRDEDEGVHLNRWQMLLTYFSASYGFGFQSMVSFLLPLRARELDAPLQVIGLMVGIAALVPALFSVPSGALADRIGPRRTFTLSTFISGVVALLFAAMTNYWGLVVLQPIFGFFRSMGWVAAQTYVTGIGTPAERASLTGRFSFAANLGPLVTPVVIGTIAEIVGYRASFLFVALAAALYTAVGLALPEVRSRMTGQTPARGSLAGFGAAVEMLRLRGVQVALMLTFVRLWLFSGWGPFFQVFLADHGFRPAVIGTVISSNSFVSVAVTLSAGRLSRLASKEVVTATALGLGALGMVLSPHVAVLPLVYLPSLLLGSASGLSLPLLMAIMSDNAPPGRRGVAMGLRTQANQLASMSAPMVSGALVPALGIAWGFAVMGVFLWSILATALWLHLSERLGRRERAYEHPPSVP